MPKRVFISYSHDDDAHRERVLALASKLRAAGFRVEFDQENDTNPPAEGLSRWMEKNIRDADIVLVTCTEQYCQRFQDDAPAEDGKGVAWEAHFIRMALYKTKVHNTRFVPIVVEAAHAKHIPDALFDTVYFTPWTADGFAKLVARIHAASPVHPQPAQEQPARPVAPTASAAVRKASSTNLPRLSPHTIKRANETKSIHRTLRARGTAGITRPAAATAAGGYGKTITAMLYAHEYASDYPGGRFFLRCELGNIQSELAALAAHVGVDDALPDAAKAAAVKAALEAGPLALLILDNITSAEQWDDPALQALLPTANTHLLITSRAVDLPGVAHVSIGRLTPQQATAMLAHFRPDASDAANVKAVRDAIEQVEGLAVAIAAMGAYMKLTPAATWARFASDLARGQLPHLQAGEPRIAAHIGYTQAISDVLDAAIFALPKPEQRALAYAAQLPADMIPRPWLAALLTADTTITLTPKLGTNPNPAEAVIDNLLALQLLRPAGEDERLLSMHRAHRAQMRFRAEKDEGEETALIDAIAAHAAGRITDIVVGNKGKGDGTIDNPAALTDQSLRWEISPLVGVCEALWSANRPGAASAVGVWLAAVLQTLQRYVEAAACLQLSPETDEAVEAMLGHERFAACYSNLAAIERYQGNLLAAQRSIKRAIAIDLKHVPPDHPALATRYCNLALIQKSLCDLPAARASIERAISIEQSRSKPRPAPFATMFSNLALIQRDQRDLPAARASIERAIDIQSRHFDNDHPVLATSYINLAVIQHDQGELPAARQSIERATAIDSKHFAPDHPVLATNYNNLAFICIDQGDILKAVELWHEAYAIRLKALGPDHPHTESVADMLRKYDSTWPEAR